MQKLAFTQQRARYVPWPRRGEGALKHKVYSYCEYKYEEARRHADECYVQKQTIHGAGELERAICWETRVVRALSDVEEAVGCRSAAVLGCASQGLDEHSTAVDS